MKRAYQPPAAPDILAPYRYFGLFREPFRLTPNRDLFFPDYHEKVLGAVLYAIERGDGIVKVSGEVGTGKTLLCRLLLQSLEDRFSVAYISAPHSDAGTITRAICAEFGLPPPGAGRDAHEVLVDFLMQRHGEGGHAVLVVDEAQALDRKGLETIRLLTNFETDEAKLLTIILFGQTELDDLLARHDMRQLAQRIAFSFATRPFDAITASRYVQHRVDLCTDHPTPHRIFSAGAMQEIAKQSRGVPRLLNLLADRALISAFGAQAQQIERRHVRNALAETAPRREASWWARLFGRKIPG